MFLRSRSISLRLLSGIALQAGALVANNPMSSHQDDNGGQSNTVTVFMRSRTILDSGFLKEMGIQIPSDELWQHGHSGLQGLRIVHPLAGPKKTGPWRQVAGAVKLCESDVVKISIVPAGPKVQGCDPDRGNCYSSFNPNATPVAHLVTTRQTRQGVGAFTNGHLFGEMRRVPEGPCFAGLRGRPRTTQAYHAYIAEMLQFRDNSFRDCLKREVQNRIKDEPNGTKHAADMDVVWVYKIVPASGSGGVFTWTPVAPAAKKPNSVVTGLNGTADAVMTTAVKKPHKDSMAASFEFRLKRNGSEDLLFGQLAVYSSPTAATPKFTATVPPGGIFTVCRNNETTGQPNCMPLAGLPRTRIEWRQTGCNR